MAVPYMRSNIVPVNCVPVCPSLSQVLNAEEKRRVLLNRGSQSTVIADALLLAYDKGHAIITIITSDQDVEMMLLNAIQYHCASQSFPLSNLPLQGGTWVGGAVVHVKPCHQHQQFSDVIHTDMVLTYDADMIGKSHENALESITFVANPAILHLCTIGTPEQRLLNFVEHIKQIRFSQDDQQDIHLDSLLASLSNGPQPSLLQENISFPDDEDFWGWNASVADQVAFWFLRADSIDYHFNPSL